MARQKVSIKINQCIKLINLLQYIFLVRCLIACLSELSKPFLCGLGRLLWKGNTDCSTFSRSLVSGFPVFLAIKFQIISRFCPGQKGHSPGYSTNDVDTKRQTPKAILKSQEYKTWKQLSQYDIKMLYILTFQVLSRFSAKFQVLSRFYHI